MLRNRRSCCDGSRRPGSRPTTSPSSIAWPTSGATRWLGERGPPAALLPATRSTDDWFTLGRRVRARSAWMGMGGLGPATVRRALPSRMAWTLLPFRSAVSGMSWNDGVHDRRRSRCVTGSDVRPAGPERAALIICRDPWWSRMRGERHRRRGSPPESRLRDAAGDHRCPKTGPRHKTQVRQRRHRPGHSKVLTTTDRSERPVEAHKPSARPMRLGRRRGSHGALIVRSS